MQDCLVADAVVTGAGCAVGCAVGFAGVAYVVGCVVASVVATQVARAGPSMIICTRRIMVPTKAAILIVEAMAVVVPVVVPVVVVAGSTPSRASRLWSAT